MRNFIVLAVTALALLAGAVAAKLHSRWKADCVGVPCAYVEIRQSIFAHANSARSGKPVYLVIGDSTTEVGRWPEICGLEPLPAGISGAQTETWLAHARLLADKVKPKVIVLALGTNDLLTAGQLGPYEQLVASLGDFELVAVLVHEMPEVPRAVIEVANQRISKAVRRTTRPITAATTDGIHLTSDDYRSWMTEIENVVCSGG